MKNDKLIPLLLIGALGLGFYYISTQTQVKPPQVPPGYNNQTTLPNGQPVWVNAAGIAVDAAGTVLGAVAAIIQAMKDAKVKGVGCCSRCRAPIYNASTMRVV